MQLIFIGTKIAKAGRRLRYFVSFRCEVVHCALLHALLVLVQYHKQQWENYQQKGSGGYDEGRHGDIHVELVYLCGQYRVDGGGAEGQDGQGVSKDWVADQQVGQGDEDGRGDDEAQQCQGAYCPGIFPHFAKINQETHRQHGNPGADVDEALEDGAKFLRPFHAIGIEQQAGGHTQKAQLVDGKEHFPETVTGAGLAD